VVVRRLAAWTILTASFVLLAVFAPGMTAFAAGQGIFTIPMGSTASFTNVQFGACNSLTWGYQVNGGANQVQATFPGGCGSGTAPNVTIGPFATPTTLRVFLTDNHCLITYNSDGTPVDHVIVTQTGPNSWSLRFADAGGFCEKKLVTVNSFTGFNFHVDLAISDRAITTSGTNISAAEGKPFTGTVATFTDPDTFATAGEYSATIAWGDGVTSAGTISGTGGHFKVSGTHTYAEEGVYHLTVRVTDTDNPSNTATANPTATVADAALTATPACAATSLHAYNGRTATFTDAASPFGTLSDFSATISWGDGTTTAGAVTGANGGPYTVSGSHTYATTGVFTITTTISDVGGSTATTSCNTVDFSFAPGGGSFVIGDKNSGTGSSVTFWGAQWAKLNSLSVGDAPRRFKGFAEAPKSPTCGIAWTADPGNSTPPPDGPLPAYMGVIVTSTAGKDGSATSGDTVHIVVVKTKPGYAPDPGHAGTGTVAEVVC
jgi:hypothetical protein